MKSTIPGPAAQSMKAQLFFRVDGIGTLRRSLNPISLLYITVLQTNNTYPYPSFPFRNNLHTNQVSTFLHPRSLVV